LENPYKPPEAYVADAADAARGPRPPAVTRAVIAFWTGWVLGLLTLIPGVREKLAFHVSRYAKGGVFLFLLGAAVTKLYRQSGFVPQTAGYSLLAASFALSRSTLKPPMSNFSLGP